MSPRRRSAIAIASLALMLFAWVFGDAPGGAPDEAANFIRAVSAAEGQWRGQAPPPLDTTFLPPSLVKPYQEQEGTTRVFDLPAGLALNERKFPCFAVGSSVSADCLNHVIRLEADPRKTPSYVGAYPPYLYAFIGLPALAASKATTAIYLVRLAGALISLLLLGGAWLCSPGRWRRTAVLVVAGPLTLFLCGTVSTNGIEVAASACFTAAALARRQGDSSRVVLGCLAAGGVALALAKSLGPVFVVLDSALVLALLPSRSARSRGSAAALAAVAAAVLAGAVWSVLYVPSTGTARQILDKVGTARAQVSQLMIGVFDYFGLEDTSLPHHEYRLGFVAAGLLALTALAVGRVRQKAALAVGAGVLYAATVGFTAIENVAGFGGQSRYTLALGASLVIAAGATVEQAPARVRRPLEAAAVVAAVSLTLLNVIAWFVDSRRYAVGDTGSKLFFLHPGVWTPPTGWLPLFACFGLGATGILWAALAGEGRRPAPPRPASPMPTLVNA